MSSNDFWPILLDISQSDWKNLKSGCNNLLTQISKIGSNIQNGISVFNSYLEKIEKIDFRSLIDNFYQSYFSNIHKELIKHGFYIGLSNWSVAETSKISELLIENDHDKIVEYFLKYLRKDENIEWFTEKWSKNVFFEPRYKFIKRGLEAHSDEDFIASIPILLPHVEAILADFFVSNGLLNGNKDKFQGNDAIKILKVLTIDSISTEIDKVFFRRFIDQKGIYNFKENSNNLNRGKILHGICLDYDKEEWSAQIIYLLDFIYDLTAKSYDLVEETSGKKILTIKEKKSPNKAN